MKKTVGSEAVKLLQNPDSKQGVVDTQREIDKEYLSEIKKCIDAHKSLDDPFYIVVIQKKERLLENVIRRYFLARKTLPTPDWDQTVWRYNPKTGDLMFLWVLPDKNTAMWMASNPQDIVTEQKPLLGYVMDFLDKKLFAFYEDMFEKKDEKIQIQVK